MADTLPAYKQAMLDGSEDDFDETIEEEEVVKQPEGKETAADNAQSPDTETETVETPEGETDTETATGENVEPTPLDAVMEELGLKKQYGTPDAALRAVLDQRQHIETQNRENHELRGLLQRQLERTYRQPPATMQMPMTADQVTEGLAVDPLKTLHDVGLVTQDQVEREVQPLKATVQQLQMEAENNRIVTVLQGLNGLGDVAQHFRGTGNWPSPGVNPLWDSMMNTYNGEPAYSQMPTGAAIAVLHNITMARQSTKPKVPPVSEKKKAGATTTSGLVPGKGGVPDMSNWPHEEILKWAKAHDMVDD